MFFQNKVLGKFENETSVQLKKSAKNRTNYKIESKTIFSIIDSALSIFIIGPMCVGFWRGLWTLMDIHITNK